MAFADFLQFSDNTICIFLFQPFSTGIFIIFKGVFNSFNRVFNTFLNEHVYISLQILPYVYFGSKRDIISPKEKQRKDTNR